MSTYSNRPEPFWELIVHNLSLSPKFTGLNVGYELGEWRYNDFADYLFEWLPEFALCFSELQSINSASAMRLIKRAAKVVYDTPKYGKRGEFGELMLHAIMREIFKSEPAISKIYYKSAVNDTVKGFDAVHIVENNGELELWLGEVKFYKDIASAIRDVVNELKLHTKRDYLREEFILINSKIDFQWKHANKLKEMISQRRSLDTVFKSLCIPVLLTYESPTISKFSAVEATFFKSLEAEMRNHYSTFSAAPLPPVNLHLFLLPLHNKSQLVDILHDKLEGLQR